MNTSVAKIGNFLLDTVFPVVCIRCDKEMAREDDYTCGCYLLPESFAFSCPVCEKRLPDGTICKPCRQKTALRRFFYAGDYDDPYLRELIQHYKYGGARVFHRELAGILIRALKIHGISPVLSSRKDNVVVTAVPLTEQKRKRRGFNQSEEIARVVAKEFDLTYEGNVLSRIREHAAQADISDKALRKENVEGSFRVSSPEPVHKKIVIVVDDVYTSGATMEECARVLKEAGAKEVWAMVIAKG